MSDQIKCLECQKTFPPKRRWQKFCCDSCRATWWAKEMEEARRALDEKRRLAG